MKPISTIITLTMIMCAPGNSIAQTEAAITRTIRPRADVKICHEDFCSSEVSLLSRHLLSEQGMIEIDFRTALFTVVDCAENLEAITTLFEAYHDPKASIEQAGTAAEKQGGEIEAAIRAVLDAQAAAWNRGDIEGYMEGYNPSPNTEFVSGDRINRGWQAVLDRYKKSYDSREKMGVLTFSDLEITVLSKDAALVLGRWRLKRANDEPHGTFTLLFRKTKNGWKIVHDHTSSA